MAHVRAHELPQVSTLDDFRALLQRSISRPQLFVVHAPSCGSDAALSGALDSLGTRAPPLHLADASAPALAPLVAQLQLSALPGRALAFGGRLVDGLAGPAAEKDVRDWLEGVLSAVESTLERQKGGDEQGKGETRALDPKAAVEQAWALVDYFLNAPSSPAAAVQPSDSGDAAAQALQALQGVLPEGSGATDAQRASALAGVACLMVAQDKLPSEVARAEACCELLSARAVGEARSLEELQSAAQQNAKDPEVWHELALAHFARGNAPAAIESALKSVRADRGWREGAARTLLLQVCSALGRGSQASKTATARLANILFV